MATRTPTVDTDEAGYCDPAANLYLGNGFTSTAWSEDRSDFWTGNVPLYQGILWCFFKLFGFGLFQARMANTVLAAAAAFLIWAALKRSGLIAQPKNRVLCVALILSGSVTSLAFRIARYDTTMFFVCSAIFFCCSLPARRWVSFAAAGFCSFLLPAAGIPMLPYSAIILTIHFAIYRKTNLAWLFAISAGVACGIAGLFLFYHHFSTFHTFLTHIFPFTSLSPGPHKNFWSTYVIGSPVYPSPLLMGFFGDPRHIWGNTMFDFSSALLFFLCGVIALKTWRSAGDSDRKFIVFTFAVALLIPPALVFIGHYHSAYRWMTYIPLAIAVPRFLEIKQFERTRIPTGLVFALVSASIFLGIPARTLLAIPGWRNRSIAPIEQVAAQIVRPSDIVVSNFKVYFALKPRAKLWYGNDLPAIGEFKLTRNLPTNEITLLCFRTPDSEFSSNTYHYATNMIGGKWKKLSLDGIAGAEELSRTRYAVDFYRRATD